jgi:hypothetical protein
MKPFRTLSLFAFSLFFAHSALAQAPETPAKEKSGVSKENTGVHHQDPASGPIVVNWSMKKVDGSANLTVNPDGTYLFSGNVKDKRKNHDFDISMALKSSLGGIIVFHFSGNDTEGVQWSKQGKSTILKENFKTFAGKIDWAGEWRTPLTSKGITKLYEEREAKKKKLKKEEAEARKKHDEKVAQEKKEEREKVEQEEVAQAQAAAQAAAQKQQSSGGSSVGSDIESAISTVGGVINTIGSIGSDIAGLF